MKSACLVLVFAREPAPGRVKTRLQPVLGPAAAAQLHARLVRRTLGAVCGAAAWSVELRATPDAAHPRLAALAGEFGVDLRTQGEGDLGARMARALREALERAEAAIVIGTDCPDLDRAYVEAAAMTLARGAPAVLGPAEDGGYVLLGLRQVAEGLFDGIHWGSDSVLGDQRRRLHEVGFDVVELPALWDVDRPEDLARLEAAGITLDAGREVRG